LSKNPQVLKKKKVWREGYNLDSSKKKGGGGKKKKEKRKRGPTT